MLKILCILINTNKLKNFSNLFQNKINFKKYRFAGKRWLTSDLCVYFWGKIYSSETLQFFLAFASPDRFGPKMPKRQAIWKSKKK